MKCFPLEVKNNRSLKLTQSGGAAIDLHRVCPWCLSHCHCDRCLIDWQSADRHTQSLSSVIRGVLIIKREDTQMIETVTSLCLIVSKMKSLLKKVYMYKCVYIQYIWEDFFWHCLTHFLSLNYSNQKPTLKRTTCFEYYKIVRNIIGGYK